jgi:DNA invertase Pin-like site-specific DNA recombinase
VNPAHLWLGTHDDNHQDCTRKGRRPDGDRNGRSLLSWDQVRAIRAAHATGATSYAELARQYEVTKGTIAHIIQGRTWRE